jgi:hypothetical protein
MPETKTWHPTVTKVTYSNPDWAGGKPVYKICWERDGEEKSVETLPDKVEIAQAARALVDQKCDLTVEQNDKGYYHATGICAAGTAVSILPPMASLGQLAVTASDSRAAAFQAAATVVAGLSVRQDIITDVGTAKALLEDFAAGIHAGIESASETVAETVDKVFPGAEIIAPSRKDGSENEDGSKNEDEDIPF